jgi:exopolyphosphatase/guanosine-5'-triphosphate,3'-diphosphate pyrophosphatase
MPDPGTLAPLFGKGDVDRLHRLATLLRLAEDVERSRDQAVKTVRVDVNGKDARLELVSDDEIAVPRWAAAREVDIFERAFGRRLVVV